MGPVEARGARAGFEILGSSGLKSAGPSHVGGSGTLVFFIYCFNS